MPRRPTPGRPRPSIPRCVACGVETPALEAVRIGPAERLVCAPHAALAKDLRPRSIAGLVRACRAGAGALGDERRKSAGRRDAPEDRRAFWRPTPDRRREERELGRRATDAAPTQLGAMGRSDRFRAP